MYKFFEVFLKAMRDSFRIISRATQGEQTVEDLQQQSFLIAHEIGTKRGSPLDFTDPADQDLLIRYVNFRNVKRGDWKLRRAAHIVEEFDEDDSNQILSIEAAPSSDPLISMLETEQAERVEDRTETLLASSYSQATAYLLTFVHFNYDAIKISGYLEIAATTLKQRVRNASEIMSRQPSLFDKIIRMDKTFVPLSGNRKAVLAVTENRVDSQFKWEFETI